MGFIDKMDQSDLFVLLDTVQYRKNYFQNRNKIRVREGSRWLTVPVAKGPHTRRICEMEIAEAADWRREHWRHIAAHYRKAPHFDEFGARLEEIYQRPWQMLADLNIEIVRTLANCLGVETELAVASDHGLQWGTGGTEVNLNLCRHFAAEVYLSGTNGRNYLDERPFARAGIRVDYQDFRHPQYWQQFEPFEEAMSSIDLLFNHGERGMHMLREANAHARG